MATSTVNDVYLYVCAKLMEPAGFQAGTYSQAQFLLLFSDVMLEFCDLTGISKMICTQTCQFSVGTYLIPDRQLRVENAYVSGKYVYHKTQQELDSEDIYWRNRIFFPRGWHEDGLPIKTIEFAPRPNFQGTAYAIDPALNNIPAQLGNWFVSDRNVTTVGAQRPPQTSYSLTDTIPLLPETAVQYLSWGVLAKILDSDSEEKDKQRAIYAGARFYEGVQAFRSMASEFIEMGGAYED